MKQNITEKRIIDERYVIQTNQGNQNLKWKREKQKKKMLKNHPIIVCYQKYINSENSFEDKTVYKDFVKTM